MLLPGENMLENVRKSPDKWEKRRHLRRTVAAICRAIVGGREYRGTVVNVSSSGMAVDFDDDLAAQAVTPGAAAVLDIESVGRVHTNVARPRNGGVAFEHDPMDADLLDLFFDD